MNKAKSVQHLQLEKIHTFWFVWKVWLPLGILITTMLLVYSSVAQDSSLEGLVLMRLISAWQNLQLSTTITAVIGLAAGTIAAIIKRSLKKGLLVGLETFLESLVGSFIGDTAASLVISAETNENTVSGIIFIFCCRFVGLIIGASWQASGWLLYQGLRKNRA